MLKQKHHGNHFFLFLDAQNSTIFKSRKKLAQGFAEERYCDILQGAPIKNNPLEKMLYFSHGSADLSQSFRRVYK